MKDLEQIHTSLELVITSFTWQRDTHNLFDYQSQSTVKNKFSIENSALITQVNDQLNVIPLENSQMPSNFFLKIERIGNSFLINQKNLKKLWKPLNCKNIQGPDEINIVKKGDFIRFGKKKYRIKDFSQRISSNDCFGEKILAGSRNFSESLKISKEVSEVLHNTCRICLSQEENNEDPLISPCNCNGTMKYIHFSCFKKWVSFHTKVKRFENFSIFSVKSLHCEISKCEIPSQIFLNTSLIETPSKSTPYLELEYFNKKKNEFRLYFIELKDQQFVKVGRGKKNEISIQDVSISREHARIGWINNELWIQDLRSRFGTLVKLKHEALVDLDNRRACFQIGKNLLIFEIQVIL